MSSLGKICLIYTGGTIGMRRIDSGALAPPSNPKDFLRVAPELIELVKFDFVDLMNKDSTNVNPADWKKIAEAIYLRKDDGYNGFLVAHGTDTMHFSASAVGFALGSNLNFPVVFTGSQTIPEVRHGDARINLLRASMVAASSDLAEVVISFGDYVFRGCRAQKKDERRFDAFESPASPPLAYITEDIIPNAKARLRKNNLKDIVLESDFAEGILQFSLIPGVEPDLLKPILQSKKCNGIILQSFGAGNVPDESPFSFMEIIKEARDSGIPIIITSQFPANATLHTAYLPGRRAIDAGAIPTGNMTSSCAVAKFRWVLAKVNKMIDNGLIKTNERISKVDELMQEVVIGEMDLPSKSK